MLVNYKTKAEKLSAEQQAGRIYNVRNATAEYAKDMKEKGIDVEAMFGDRFTPMSEWKVRVADEVFTMEQFNGMLILMGYIK